MTHANFTYKVPTQIYFGDQQIEQIGTELRKYGKKVLLIYGSERIKATKVYQIITEKIAGCGMELFEMGGVEPNPRSYSVNQAADICKKEQIDVLLPVGGGSVVDCAKLVSPAAFYDGDCWDLVSGKAQMEKFLPIVVVPTISGTGTDMDAYGIVSNADTLEKLPFFHTNLYPAAAFLDPTLTYSVSPYQTACGAIDAFSHYLEVYFMRPNLYVLDRAMEGFMKTILHYIPKVMTDPTDYEARANIMWASSWALSGFTFGPTNGVPFMCHWIEDEVSAKYDITHGLGLAIILPKYLDYCLNENSAPLYHELAVNVFDIDPATPAIEAGKICIEKLKTLFYDVCGLKPQFNDYFEMDESKFDEMAQIACRGDVIHGFVDLTAEDAKEILRRCL